MKLAKHKYERVLQKMAQDTKASAAGLPFDISDKFGHAPFGQHARIFHIIEGPNHSATASAAAAAATTAAAAAAAAATATATT